MKETGRTPKWALGLALLAALGAVLVVLLGQDHLVGLAARPPATATKQPTPTPALTWENATLDHIHFGEPQEVFTHNGRIRIYDWLPDKQRLLLAIEDPTTQNLARQFRVVTLDVITGEIVEYGRRPDWNLIHPVWLEGIQGVAFVTYDNWANEPPQVLLSTTEGSVYTIDENKFTSLAVDPRTGHLFYLKHSDDLLRVFDVQQNKAIASPLNGMTLPWGRLRIEPGGRWLVSFFGQLSHSPLHLADLEKAQVTEIELGDPYGGGEGDGWPLEAVWNPDGNELALIMGQGTMLLSRSNLVLLKPETLDWRSITLPAQVVSELEWGPEGRFLLVKGELPGYTATEPHYKKLWLVDTTNGGYKELAYFPPVFSPESTFMAWAKDGRVVWLRGNQVIITQAMLKKVGP